jgi:hypothetical protein
MGDYTRSTREIKFENFSAETKNAINQHIELYNLGAILNETLICIESTSEKIKKGLFSGSGAKTVRCSLVLTPRWLIQVIKTDNDAAVTRSARLADIVVSDYEKSPFHAKIPDTGVEVSGRFTDTSESSTSFFGLGKDEAGEKFKTLLIEAVQTAKK